MDETNHEYALGYNEDASLGVKEGWEVDYELGSTDGTNERSTNGNVIESLAMEYNEGMAEWKLNQSNKMKL